MKRPREGAYDAEMGTRAEETKEFIRTLRFSVPLANLRSVKERAPCPSCGKRRLYYCYDCLKVCHPDTHPPPLSLPLNVHVILHPGEHRSKSTSLAASTISPDLHISSFPNVPDSLDVNTTLVLYPSAQSVLLNEVENLHNYKNVVFVDSTWQQSKSIVRDARVTQFKHVRIPQRTSLFWRFQNNDPSYLATVEAIYYFLREYVFQVAKQESRPEPYYRGEVDDLLFYYINQYIMVQQNYAASNGAAGGDDGEKKFTTRHFQDYVLSGVSWDDIAGTEPSPSDATS